MGYIDVLRHVADVVLAPAVIAELRAGPGKPGSGAPDLPWIEVRPPAVEAMDETLRGLDAHAGEQEIMALAVGEPVVPVIDEGPARRYATERGLPVISMLAILMSPVR